MRSLFAAVVCVASIAALSSAADPSPEPRSALAVRSDFEGGSARVLSIDQDAGVIRVQPGGDPKLGWPCWWSFTVTGIDRPRPLMIVVDASALKDHNNRPFDPSWALPVRATWSADGKTWRQTADGKAGKGSMTYNVRVEAGEAHFAWAEPFTGSTAAELIRQVAARCREAKSFVLCRTPGGRDVPAVRFGRPGEGKFGVWVQARQHAWECGSSHVAAGLLEWLAGDDDRAAALRSRACVTVVPVMDVDNVAVGAGGKNQPPHDHNRDWSDKPLFASVAAAQKEILSLIRQGGLEVCLDLHNPGRGDREPFFFMPPRDQCSDANWADYQRFLAGMRREMVGPLTYKGRARESGPKYDPKMWQYMGASWMRQATDGHAIAMTLETPWSLSECSTANVRRVGRELGLAIELYLRDRRPTAPPAQEKDTMNVLFIGNSYTYVNDLPGTLAKLAAAGPGKLRIQTDKQLEGGQSLMGHWNKGKAVEKIRKGGWDFVVLQDQSLTPAQRPHLTREYAPKFDAEIRKAGAKTMFYMTWARKKDPPMIDKLSRTYTEVARELGAGVAPVGLAWKAAIEKQPELNLYAADGSHPSPAGTYLAACVFYATLTGEDPTKLPPDVVKAVPAETARFLQQVARDTVAARSAAPAAPGPASRASSH